MHANSSTSSDQSKSVAIASIASELHAVMDIAWGVSLAAKNAKVISAQAGEKALGFQPITDFIDEISVQAINSVNEINQEATKLSRITVNEQRSQDAYRRFSSVIHKNADARHIGSLAKAMTKVEEHMLDRQHEFKTCIRKLIMALEEMDQCMLAARAIASVSRIVTSNSQEYRANLQVVSDDLDKAAIYIKEKVSDSYKHLSKLNDSRYTRA